MARLLLLLGLATLASAAGVAVHPCPAPRGPLNGATTMVGDGSEVRFSCHPGYELRGAPRAWCFDGQWSFPAPVCVPVAGSRPEEESARRRQYDGGRGEPQHKPYPQNPSSQDPRATAGSYGHQETGSGYRNRDSSNPRYPETRPSVYRHEDSVQGGWNRTSSRGTETRPSGGSHRAVDLGKDRTNPSDRYGAHDYVKGGMNQESSRNRDSRPIQGIKTQTSQPDGTRRNWEDTSRNVGTYSRGGETTEIQRGPHRKETDSQRGGRYSGSTDSKTSAVKETPPQKLESRKTDDLVSQTSVSVKGGYESGRQTSRPLDGLKTGDRRDQQESHVGRDRYPPPTSRPTINPYDRYRQTHTRPPISVSVRVYPTQSVWPEDNRRGQNYMSEDDIINKELERQIGEAPYKQENEFNRNVAEKTREPVNEEWLNRLSPELRERFLAKLEHARRYGNATRSPYYTSRPTYRPSPYNPTPYPHYRGGQSSQDRYASTPGPHYRGGQSSYGGPSPTPYPQYRSGQPSYGSSASTPYPQYSPNNRGGQSYGSSASTPYPQYNPNHRGGQSYGSSAPAPYPNYQGGRSSQSSTYQQSGQTKENQRENEQRKQHEAQLNSTSSIRTKSCSLSNSRPPFIRNAYVMKYMIPRGGPLLAVYGCIDGFRLANPDHDRLACQQGRWSPTAGPPECVRAV